MAANLMMMDAVRLRADLAAERHLAALLRQIGAGSVAEAEATLLAWRAERHARQNDLAAYRMVMDAVMRRLGAASHETVLTVLDSRLADAAALGRPALVLVAQDESADLLVLRDGDDPRAQAESLVRSGEIGEVVLARLLGRVSMPDTEPEWRSA